MFTIEINHNYLNYSSLAEKTIIYWLINFSFFSFQERKFSKIEF